MTWFKFDELRPEPGRKVVLASPYGDYCVMALVVQATPEGGLLLLDAEEGLDLGVHATRGSIWTYLPDTYDLHFMTLSEDDWR